MIHSFVRARRYKIIRNITRKSRIEKRYRSFVERSIFNGLYSRLNISYHDQLRCHSKQFFFEIFEEPV